MNLKEVMAVNLRRIRHDKKMTQEELADRAGLSAVHRRDRAITIVRRIAAGR